MRHYELYFIANKRRSHVKIGVSTNPGARLLDLQAGNHEPLQIDLTLRFEQPRSAIVYEDALHQFFAAHWLHREWFRYAPPIREYVDAWRDGDAPEIPIPLTTCAAFMGHQGACLPKAEVMAILRKQARTKK